jgi:transposase
VADNLPDVVITYLKAVILRSQFFKRIQEQGFAGGYSILKDFVRGIRPQRSRAYLTLAFAPGECAQVDWGSFGSVAVRNTARQLSFFVMVLCYSRMLYLEFTVSQSLEHFLACHQNAFRSLDYRQQSERP